MKISIIVPAYNEEATILEVLGLISNQNISGVDFETIVIDDCSRDGTLTRLKSRPDLYAHLVTMPRNEGKGGAVLAGLMHASGDFVLFQDADLEYHPSEYVRMLSPILEHNADIVIGSRISAPPVTRVYYYWHMVGNRLITFLFNVLFNTTFTDIYCGLLVYRRRLLNPSTLKTRGWEQQAEILARIVPKANRIFEIPISYFGRTYAEGKKIHGGDAFAVIGQILLRRFVD
jgi:glycosyltransferase involved in cell wall biosynthesis